MDKTVDYYMTMSSPYTYLGAARLGEIVAEARARLACRPVDYGKIFAATGGLPLKQRSRQRQAYRLMELRRWRKRLGIPINVEPKHFPVSDGLANRTLVALREQGGDPFPLSIAFGRAVWEEERDIADPDTLIAIAAAQGLEGRALVAAAEGAAVAAVFAADTEAAIERGVFGAPTYAFGDELFWGQDRLEFLAEALAAG